MADNVTALVRVALLRAREEIVVPRGYGDAASLKALMHSGALKGTMENIETNRSVQFHLVAMMARDDPPMWEMHPPTQDFPEGFAGETGLPDFLDDCGITKRTKSLLVDVGGVLVPYASGRQLNIEKYMTNSLRPKLEAAMRALKEEIRGENHDAVDDILSDVETFSGREAIRAKYQKPKRARIGRGTTIRLDNGIVVMPLVIDSEDDVERIVSRLSSAIEWGLPATAHAAGGMIEVSISENSNH